MHDSANRLRVRWAAIGAAVAVTLGAGGIATVGAVVSSGERLVYVPGTPCRLIDTRPEVEYNVGPRDTPLGPAETITVQARGAQGQCSAAQLPNDAVALALNVTVPSATADGFLTIWPDGARPNASSLNPSPGQPPVPNAVTTSLSAAGTFDVYNENGATHVIVDVVGYHADHDHSDETWTETISFPAESLNYRNNGSVTQDTGGRGLRWEYNGVGGAELVVQRPPDWVAGTDVTLRITFSRATSTQFASRVAFFARVDGQSVGDDPGDVGTGVMSDSNLSFAANARQVVTITLPAARLGTDDWWVVVIQRDTSQPLALPDYSGDVYVDAVSLGYTARRPG